jgi:hypothetical protein
MIRLLTGRRATRRPDARSYRPQMEAMEGRRLLAASLYAVGSGVGDSSSNLYRIANHATTPSVVDLGETGVRLTDLAIHPGTWDGYAVSISNLGPSKLYRVNLADGDSTLVGDTGITSFSALEFAPDGTLYAMRANNNTLYTINTATGAATALGNIGVAGQDLAYDHTSDLLYVTNGTELYRVKPTTLATRRLGDHGVNHIVGLEIDESGTLFASRGGPYSSFTPTMYRVNKATGAATAIATIAGVADIGNNGLAFNTGPTMRINNVRVTETHSGTVTATFTVRLSIASTRSTGVNFATANGSATAGSDYTAAGGTLTFQPGQTTRTITVTVRGDTLKEANETFFVNLSGPTSNTLLRQKRGVGTILNDD